MDANRGRGSKGKRKKVGDWLEKCKGKNRGTLTPGRESIHRVTGNFYERPWSVGVRYRPAGSSNVPLLDPTSLHPPRTSFFRSFAARQLSLIRSRGPSPCPLLRSNSPLAPPFVCGGELRSRYNPVPVKKAQRRRPGTTVGKKCRSIYIIINRKEIYLIPWPKDSLFPLRLI